jgi:hypothetical protein
MTGLLLPAGALILIVTIALFYIGARFGDPIIMKPPKTRDIRALQLSGFEMVPNLRSFAAKESRSCVMLDAWR